VEVLFRFRQTSQVILDARTIIEREDVIVGIEKHDVVRVRVGISRRYQKSIWALSQYQSA